MLLLSVVTGYGVTPASEDSIIDGADNFLHMHRNFSNELFLLIVVLLYVDSSSKLYLDNYPTNNICYINLLTCSKKDNGII